MKTAFPKLYALSIWAVESRYPGDMPDVVDADAQEAMRLAEAIYQTIAEDMRKYLDVIS